MANESQTPNPSNSDSNATTVGGNVTSSRDFVGRDNSTVHGDQVEGDKVAGDKVAGHKITTGVRSVGVEQSSDSIIITGDSNIVGDSNTVVIQRLDPANVRSQRNHRFLRELVKRFWIDGVLKSSLHHEIITLNLEYKPSAVDNSPWNMILQTPTQPDCLLPPGTQIIDVFDEQNHSLLILGGPGSGKTTVLLELTEALIKRAEADLTYPTPVVFNLSSWSVKQQHFNQWLVNELIEKYQVSKKFAISCLRDDALLLLLDGLDEMHEKNRSVCIDAINDFRKEHDISIAVCSRTADYEMLNKRLRLQSAVVLQPFTSDQIDKYFQQIGSHFILLGKQLQNDSTLQELAKSPLMLNTVTLAYEDGLIDNFENERAISSLHKHLFNVYIQRMFLRRMPQQFYTPHQALRWLSWLAENMLQQHQTIFLIERLQPHWLYDYRKILVYKFFSHLVLVVTVGLAIGLSSGLTFELIHWFAKDRPDNLTELMLNGILSANITTGIIGLIWVITGILFVDPTINPIERIVITRINLKSLMNSLKKYWELSWRIGILIGLLVGCLLFTSIGALAGELQGLGIGEFLTELLLLPIISIFAGAIIGSIVGVVIWICGQFTIGLPTKIFKDEELVEHIRPNQGIWNSVQNALIGGLIGILMFVPAVALISWFYGDVYLNIFTPIIGVPFGMLYFGGDACLQHMILRIFLYQCNLAPFNYSHFLNYCHNLIFLRKVGGGYIFIHRILLEHFANMSAQDIERLATAIEAER